MQDSCQKIAFQNSFQRFLKLQAGTVVIVGSTGYGGELDEKAKVLAETYQHVTWLGQVSNDELLLALWQHAGAYFHGHSVGGTNPALVQAIAAGAPSWRGTPFLIVRCLDRMAISSIPSLKRLRLQFCNSWIARLCENRPVRLVYTERKSTTHGIRSATIMSSA